jgi:hypothetical protein
VAPFPVPRLLGAIQCSKVAILAVLLRKIGSVIAVLATIPAMVVTVLSIVDPHPGRTRRKARDGAHEEKQGNDLASHIVTFLGSF